MKHNDISYKSAGKFEESRYEKIHNVIFDNSSIASLEVAKEISDLIKSKQEKNQKCIIGLATDNQTWLYLSALGRVKRIAGGDSDEETEPASIFGSEFTTEDTDTGKLAEYSFKRLEDTTQSNRKVWKVESLPNAERAKKSRYSRTVHYIDQERYVVLRSEMYDKYGKEIKRVMASRVELVNDNWLARSITMMNLVSNRLSNMAFVEIYTDLVTILLK